MPMSCRGCGCTDNDACIGRDGLPCHWVSTNPSICSSCSGDAQMAGVAEDNGDLDTAAPVSVEQFGNERCEASLTLAFHAPIFLDGNSGYCARCKLGFFT